MQDRLMSLEEAAMVMRCSYSKAQRLAKAGELPFRKLGSTWVISESALTRSLGLEAEMYHGGDCDVEAIVAY